MTFWRLTLGQNEVDITKKKTAISDCPLWALLDSIGVAHHPVTICL